MKRLSLRIFLLLWTLAFAAIQTAAFAQAGFNDDRVMVQGFYWESCRNGHPDSFPALGDKPWYELVRDQVPAIRDARFDLIWLPPPSYAGGISAGYDPREYFRLDNSYGSFDQHRALLAALLQNGVEPVADIVINHRNGSEHWADFKNPRWGTWAITRNDESFLNPESEVYGTPVDKRGAEEESPAEYAPHGGTTYGYESFRDLDHTNIEVRRDIVRYLLQLQSMGYRGWRYDMTRGFHAKWIAVYNRATKPTFSVGEFWDQHDWIRGWVYHTATRPEDLSTASGAFDFSAFYTLKNNRGRYDALYGFGKGIGLAGDNTDGLPWKNRAVTFLENHDTGYRTNWDGSPEKDHTSDSFMNDWQVEQGYAYILTHPGVPCVYWKHYWDWGSDLRERIKALINARKVAGVNAGSELNTQDNARARGVYAARVVGTKGMLYVRIGGSDEDWRPDHSNYHDYREYAGGSGWKVWVALPGNPEVQQAPLKPALPIPTYHKHSEIDVTDSMIAAAP